MSELNDMDFIELERSRRFLKQEFAKESEGLTDEQLGIVPGADIVTRLEWLRKAKGTGVIKAQTPEKQDLEEELSSWASEVYVNTPVKSS